MLKGIALSTLADYMPTTSDIAELRARGVDALRLEIDPHAGPGALAYLTTHGIQLVALIGAALLPDVTNAEWNAPVQSATFFATRVRWQRAVYTALRNTAGGLTIPFVEVWSEPNNSISPHSSGLHPANFAHLYRAAHDVILQEHPRSKIITGGLFAHATSAVPYLQHVREALPILFDHVGWHCYLDSGGGLQQKNLLAFLSDIHQTFGKTAFITEAGWATTVVSQQQQEANFATLFETARQSGLVEGVLAFTLDDAPGANPSLFFGIRNKETWQAFRRY